MGQRGLTHAGNVDLYAQPVVRNPDGTTSTVDSSSYNIDGREVLLPSVTPDGRHLKTADEIVGEYQRTGRHLGMFDTPDNATAYAKQLHNDYAAGKYSRKHMADPKQTETYLRSLNTSDRARAAAFDAVHNLDDGAAQKLLTQLPFSDAVKAELWDLRAGGTVSGGAAPVPASAEQSMDQSGQPQGSATSRFLSNLGEQLNPVTMATGMYNAVRHPIDTATNIYNAQSGQFDQAVDAYRQGNYSEMAGHGLASALPVVGPAAAAIGEQGASGDYAGMFGAATGLIAPFGAVPAMRAGVTGAARTAGRVGRVVAPEMTARAATALETGAADRVANVMSPKGGPNARRFGNMARDVAPDLVTNPDFAAGSKSGFHAKIADGLQKASDSLDDLAEQRSVGKVYETKPILSDLMKERQKLVSEAVDASQPQRTVVERTSPIVDERGQPITTTEHQARPLGKDVDPAPTSARIAALDQVISEVKQLGPVAHYEALRRIRQAWDGVAKQVYSSAVTDDFLKKQGEAFGAADATSVLREHLAGFEPETAAANAQYRLFRTANDVMKAAEEVDRARPKVGRRIMARLTGVIAGGHAAGVGGELVGYALGPVVDSFLSSGITPSIKTARMMSDLAQALRTGNVERAASTVGKMKAAAKVTGKSALSIGQVTAAPMAAAGPANSPPATAQR